MQKKHLDWTNKYDYTFRSEEVFGFLEGKLPEMLKKSPYFGRELSYDEVISDGNVSEEVISKLIGSGRVSVLCGKSGKRVFNARDTLYLMNLPYPTKSFYRAVDLEFDFDIDGDEAHILIEDGYLGILNLDDDSYALDYEDVLTLYDKVFPEDIFDYYRDGDYIDIEGEMEEEEITRPYGVGYSDALRKRPMISRWEEERLAEKIKNGDIEARNALAEANLRFAGYIAKKFSSGKILLEDLISSANLGLLEAAESFEVRGNKFISFAKWQIEHRIYDTIGENSIVRIPLSELQRYGVVKKIVDRIEQNVGEHINPMDYIGGISEGLNFNPNSHILACVRDNLPLMSAVPLRDQDAVSSDSSYENLVSSLIGQELNDSLSKLSPRDEIVLRLYFGLGYGDYKLGEDLTLDEIGGIIGVTSERARQIKETALNRLKHPFYTRRLQDLSSFE